MTLLIVIISIGFSMVASSETNNSDPKTRVFADPELIGPEKLCNVFGSVIADFYGAGDPLTDVYSWKIFGPSDQLLFNRAGGAGFQTISYTFSLIGTHRVELTVARPGAPLFTQSQNVELISGPQINLLPNYDICDSNGISLTAISPNSSNFSNYIFEWKDSEGNIVGSTNTIDVFLPDTYTATFFFEDDEGNMACDGSVSTEVTLFDGYEIESSTPFICPDFTVTFTNSLNLNGSWSYKKAPNPQEEFLGFGKSVLVTPILDLNQPGDYEIIFKPDPISGNACLLPNSYFITYYPQPDYEIIDSRSSSECFVADGSITVQANTALDQIFLEELGLSSPPLNPGDTYEFKNLKSGAYTFTGQLGGCSNYLGGVVTLKTPPKNLDFTIENITGEICTDDGKLNGLIDINFPNGPINGWYRLINEKGTLIRNSEIQDASDLQISVTGGEYYFELYGQDSCRIPKAELINVPGLEQTLFEVPELFTICQSFELFPESNQNLDYRLVLPDGSTEVKSTGDPFILTTEGSYKITGFLPNQSDVCPSTLEFEVELVEAVEFEPKLILQDCFGNRTYFAEIYGRDPNSVIFSWYNENDELIGTGQNMFPTSIGEFKLDVQPANSEACPIPPVKFLIEEPVLEVDATLASTKLCELGPGATINLSTTFFSEVTDIEWRRYNSAGDIEELDQFKDKTEITVFEDGIYEAAVFSIIPEIGKDCELGRNSMELSFTKERVEFNIPDSLSICESFEFIPETTQDLEFILTFPDGSEAENQAGQAFTLNQTGTYSLYGYHPEISSPNCPEIKEFYVFVNQPIPFEPILFSEDCNGQKIYQAKLTGATPSDALFFWYDENQNLIGTEEFLTFNGESGIYSLLVQPKNSEPCDLEPIEFEVPEPLLALDVNLIAAPFCPDALDAAISVDTDLEKVSIMEWWFTDLNGNQVELTNQKNKPEILATQEGTYEVRIFNSVPCLIGSDLVLLTRSMDEVRPLVEESYQICPRYDIAPNINPGDFASYEWYYGDQLVSTSPTYKPLLVGQFDLVVYSEEGCAYSTSFETIEECELKVVFPNALELGNPDKNFLIYTNYLVNELEVWIYNKWGELIFNCKNTELINEESTCFWDGTLNGEKIPNGAYSIRVNYKNYAKDINEIYLGSLMVIE
ncbi:hypothetical protein FHS59_004204 [Algoriphagus iocasae]|uniref:Ig-like domain-containing protein n=1 Tax=Algoriphagus iocasae TaxID=1836499 RepID=A0A841N0U6_9BACT|nr:gliding motility-associated C-terminal domain-containing protein [Algoriphagus iocasae]MBB6328548.1 hypothetical protein [Algoriphagus iocasae]